MDDLSVEPMTGRQLRGFSWRLHRVVVLWICALDPFSYLIPAGATAAQCPGAVIVIFSAWLRRQKECEGKKNARKNKIKQNKIQDQKENKKRKTRNKWGTGGACQPTVARMAVRALIGPRQFPESVRVAHCYARLCRCAGCAEGLYYGV